MRTIGLTKRRLFASLESAAAGPQAADFQSRDLEPDFARLPSLGLRTTVCLPVSKSRKKRSSNKERILSRTGLSRRTNFGGHSLSPKDDGLPAGAASRASWP